MTTLFTCSQHCSFTLTLFFYIHCLFCSLRVVIGKMKKKKKTLGKTCDFLFFPPLLFLPPSLPVALSFSRLPRQKGSLSLSLSGSAVWGAKHAVVTWGRGGGSWGFSSLEGKETWPPFTSLLSSSCPLLVSALRCRWTCRRGLPMTGRRWQ